MVYCVLHMHRECRESFPCRQLQRKPLLSDPGMNHGMCVTHVLRCMSGSLTRGGGENVPGIPGACATLNFTYLERGPFLLHIWDINIKINSSKRAQNDRQFTDENHDSLHVAGLKFLPYVQINSEPLMV